VEVHTGAAAEVKLFCLGGGGKYCVRTHFTATATSTAAVAEWGPLLLNIDKHF